MHFCFLTLLSDGRRVGISTSRRTGLACACLLVYVFQFKVTLQSMLYGLENLPRPLELLLYMMHWTAVGVYWVRIDRSGPPTFPHMIRSFRSNTQLSET
jgi:hypothetical protein